MVDINEPYVAKWIGHKGYGFIYVPNQQKQLFFHISDVKNRDDIGEVMVYDRIKSYSIGYNKNDTREKAIDIVIAERKENNE